MAEDSTRNSESEEDFASAESDSETSENVTKDSTKETHSHETQNESISEAQEETHSQTQDETQSRVQDEIRSQTQEETRSQTQGETHSQTQDKTHSQTQEETHSQAQEETHSQAQEETHSQTQEETHSQTQEETRSQTQEETRSQTQDETHSQTQDETRSQTQDETHSQTQEETCSQTQEETRSQTQDETRSQAQNETQSQSQKQEAQSSGWGSWGWGNIWNSSVSAVTGSAQAISKGFTNVVSNVEETLGVPSPQEIARDGDNDDNNNNEDSERDKDEDSATNSNITTNTENISPTTTTTTATTTATTAGGFGGLFSGFASAVQSTSMNIVSGGLDALEVIGRKTVDIISEGDPGLRKKRAMLSSETKTLSQLLREAREESSLEMKESSEQNELSLSCNYGLLFEQYGGLVHLEALELLSEECHSKLEEAYKNDDNIKKRLDSLCQYFNIDQEEEEVEEGKLQEIKILLKDFDQRIKIDHLLKVCEDAHLKVNEASTITTETGTDNNELYKVGLHLLAEVCSLSIQCLRKTAELTLLPEADCLDMKDHAQNLHRVTGILSNEFESLVSIFAEKITEKSSSEETNQSVTNLYLEASNSSSYLQNAFKLLLPVVQYKTLTTLSV